MRYVILNPSQSPPRSHCRLSRVMTIVFWLAFGMLWYPFLHELVNSCAGHMVRLGSWLLVYVGSLGGLITVIGLWSFRDRLAVLPVRSADRRRPERKSVWVRLGVRRDAVRKLRRSRSITMHHDAQGRLLRARLWPGPLRATPGTAIGTPIEQNSSSCPVAEAGTASVRRRA